MVAPPEPPQALTAVLLCGDSTAPCTALVRAIEDAGFELVATVDLWSDAVQLVAERAVDVAVVDLDMVGALGLRIVPVLMSVQPGCEVIVISPWPELGVASLDAGAVRMVQPSDLRPLGAALRHIAATRTGV